MNIIIPENATFHFPGFTTDSFVTTDSFGDTRVITTLSSAPSITGSICDEQITETISGIHHHSRAWFSLICCSTPISIRDFLNTDKF